MKTIKLKHNTSEWLSFRTKGIGGSDAAAILGINPWKSNLELWQEKTGIVEPKPVTCERLVKYGTDAEKPLLDLFKLDYPEYKVRVNKNVVYQENFMFASLDAELTELSTGAQGIYEGKTSEVMSRAAREKWKGQVPDNYYVQLLHYFLVTGRTFAKLKSQLKWYDDGDTVTETRVYNFKAEDCKADMEYLLAEETKFWWYVTENKQPPKRLPNI